MTDNARKELLYVIAMFLIVVAVMFGAMRHTYQLQTIRELIDIESSASAADIGQVSKRVSKTQRDLDRVRDDELIKLRSTVRRIESEELLALRSELDQVKLLVEQRNP